MSRLILNRYEQLEPKGKSAGQGVSGVVIRARDTQGEHGIVAIKRPNPMLSPVDSRKKSVQIKREGEALKRLNHPNACRYLEDKELPGSQGHYVIMEWAQGTQLETRLRACERTGEPFPPGEALEILDQLANLLAHAHEKEVIHNDIDAKHLFWDEGQRRLTVIDWANCALGSDTRPIATEMDDLNQYGELMHRVLTGSTLDSATRLGKERGWRIEMEDKKIDPALQRIVARSVGRDGNPYGSMRELATELRIYKQQRNRPFAEQVRQIGFLLEEEESTYETLAQAKTLIDQVADWDPTLVQKERSRLEEIEMGRSQHLALVRAKVSIRNEEWETAYQRIEGVFGADPQTMPLEARLAYWGSLLLNETETDSPEYRLRKEAAEALLLREPADIALAFDYLLLSYGSDQPDYDPLMAELARQLEQPYPPLRSRLPQAQAELDSIGKLELPDQLGHYRKLQETIAAEASDSARQLLDELIHTLQEADSVAQYGHDYEKARAYFQRAFHLDAHNYHLYHLSDLMARLEQATGRDPQEWQQLCDHLAGQERYGFAAAQYYLEQAKVRIELYVKRNIEYIRQFRLDTAWTELESARQERSLASPLIQCTWLLCAAYRHLYGYGDEDLDRVSSRLAQAGQALDQARREPISAGPAALREELEIATALVHGYNLLYEAGLLQLESIHPALENLPHQETHRLIKQLQLELDRLANWKEQYRTLLAECSRHRYNQAAAYARQFQETDQDQEVFQWLNPARRPTWLHWRNFSETAQAGLTDWHNGQYLPASEKFKAAARQVPIYIDGQVPQTLKSELELIANRLRTLADSMARSQKLLSVADNFETVQPVPGIVQQATRYENEITGLLGGELKLAASVELADQFVKLVLEGRTEALHLLLAQDTFSQDPLLPGYQRIAGILSQAMHPQASLSEVVSAVKLAPQSRQLSNRQAELEELEQALIELLQSIRQAEIQPAQRRLLALKQEHPALPRPFICLEHLLAGYAQLAGDPESSRARLAADRLGQAEQSLREAQRSFRDIDRAELGREIETLTGLLRIYRAIHHQGLEALDVVQTEAARLQDSQHLTDPHQFITRLGQDVAGLEQWDQRRARLFADLTQHHYDRAVSRLQQMSEAEKAGVRWLGEDHRPDLAAWERFCQAGQQIIALWQAHAYDRAADELAALGDKIPAGLPPAMTKQLQDQYQRMAADLDTLQGHITESRRILEETDKASAYTQVDHQLSQAQMIEDRYPPHLAGKTSIVSVQNRYRSFNRLVQQQDFQGVKQLIAEGKQAGDPLVATYEPGSQVAKEGPTGPIGAGPSEMEGSVWRSDKFGLNWEGWSRFGAKARQTSRQPVKLLGLILVAGLVLVACYQLVALGFISGGWRQPPGETPTVQAAAGELPAANPGSVATSTSTATPEPVPTDTPTATPEPTATQTATPAPTATQTATPAPTATPPSLVSTLGQTSRLDILALEQWEDQAQAAEETTSRVYTTPPDFWHVVTGNEAHTFWVDREFQQQNPFEFKVALNLVAPTSSYGLALQEEPAGPQYEFLLSQGESLPGQFSFRVDDEVIATGPVLTYDFSQSDRSYNSISVRVSDNFIALIVNDEEQVYVYQAPQAFGSTWSVGLSAGPDSHAIIGSAYLFELTPVQ